MSLVRHTCDIYHLVSFRYTTWSLLFFINSINGCCRIWKVQRPQVMRHAKDPVTGICVKRRLNKGFSFTSNLEVIFREVNFLFLRYGHNKLANTVKLISVFFHLFAKHLAINWFVHFIELSFDRLLNSPHNLSYYQIIF